MLLYLVSKKKKTIEEKGISNREISDREISTGEGRVSYINSNFQNGAENHFGFTGQSHIII